MTYTVTIRLEDGTYALLSVRGRTEWKTLQTAKKHAKEFKARHMRDAWAEGA